MLLRGSSLLLLIIAVSAFAKRSEPDKYDEVYLGKGKISHFGGPHDPYMSSKKTAITEEPGNKLNPNHLYCAHKWNYKKYPKKLLKRCKVKVVAPTGEEVLVKPVDYGPKKRFLDVSPRTMKELEVQTDDVVTAYLLVPKE